MTIRIACVVEAWVDENGQVCWASWPATADEEDIRKIKAFSWPVTPETARCLAQCLIRAAEDAELLAADVGVCVA